LFNRNNTRLSGRSRLSGRWRSRLLLALRLQKPEAPAPGELKRRTNQTAAISFRHVYRTRKKINPGPNLADIDPDVYE